MWPAVVAAVAVVKEALFACLRQSTSGASQTTSRCLSYL